MGLPQGNDADYKMGSPISHAAGLRGNLLIVHGSGDDNVHYQRPLPDLRLVASGDDAGRNTGARVGEKAWRTAFCPEQSLTQARRATFSPQALVRNRHQASRLSI
jgi:hypothetical protein